METTPDIAPAKSGAAAATAPPAAAKRIELSLVARSLIDRENNYRKSFDPKELAELAISVRTHGVITPLGLRPRKGGRFGLVAGERRIRACELTPAEIKKMLPNVDPKEIDALGPAPTEILAVIEDLTDAQVRERQVIENHQRADVPPLELAQAFRDMIDKDGHTQQTIAAKIGKSPASVRATLKLLELPAATKKELTAGTLSASHALLIARIPKKEWQEQCTTEALGRAKDYYDTPISPEEIQAPDGEGGRKQSEAQPLSVRALAAHIEAKYMLRLELAKFPIDDAELVKSAGACTTCDYRTGNQRELFAETSSPDLCTNGPCFEKKTAAYWDRAAAAALRGGVKVLEGKATRGIFDEHGDGARIAYNSKYADPADELPWDVAQASGKKTWGELIGKAEVPKILVKDGKGQPRELIERAAALEVARKAGTLKVGKAGAPAASTGASSGGKGDTDYKEQRRKEQERDALKRKIRAATLGAIAKAAAAEPKTDKARNALWAFIANAAIGALNEATMQPVIHRRDLGKASSVNQQSKKTLRTFIAGADADETRALVVELLAAQPAWSGEKEWLEAAAELFGIDRKKVEADVKAEAKAAEKTKADDAKAKAKAKKQPPNLAAKAKKK